MGARSTEENPSPVPRGQEEAALRSAPALAAQASASANPFPKRFTRQELICFAGREGRGRGGGRAASQQRADEWSLCARCCSAVTTSTFSGGRKRASSAPPIRPTPAPFTRCLLSGPPARTRRAAPQNSSGPGSSHRAGAEVSRCGDSPARCRGDRVCSGVSGSRGE